MSAGGGSPAPAGRWASRRAAEKAQWSDGGRGPGKGSGGGGGGSGGGGGGGGVGRGGGAGRPPRTGRPEREALPVEALREEFMQKLGEHQVLIVVGETGSGKTTQLPQYAVDAGFSRVVCTQPRRVAAITISRRVAQERGVQWGAEVGYTVRFDDWTSSRTSLKYATDGILLQECMSYPQFEKYDVVFLDEVHERTLATDILLGLLKQAVQASAPLRVVIMSATFDCVRFSDFFSGAPILNVPGRLYPVELFHFQRPVEDYLEETLTLVLHLLLFEEGTGDILAFLTGEEEIEQACAVLGTDPRFREARNVEVLPLYSALPPEAQQRVFDVTPGVRKVVFSTNIAETSVTIPGVVYVIDCGYSKQKVFLPGPRVETLLVQPISKASARQRAGRAGRTRPGRCYRLYSAEAFEAMADTTAPEVLRTNVSHVLLQLGRLGRANLLAFPFVDPPPVAAAIRGLEALQVLGALNVGLSATELGRQMSQLPVDPLLSSALLQAHHEGCTRQVAAIVAMLSVPKLYVRSDRESEGHIDRAQRVFQVRDGDHLMLLKIYNYYVQACTGDLNAELDPRVVERGCPAGRAFCQKHRLQEKSIRQAVQIRQQLLQALQRMGVPCPGIPAYDYDTAGYSYIVRRALCRGMFPNVACLLDYNYVVPTDGNAFRLHPSTCLKGDEEWVLYHEAIVTEHAYLRVCSKVDREWLTEFAPRFVAALRQGAPTPELKAYLATALRT